MNDISFDKNISGLSLFSWVIWKLIKSENIVSKYLFCSFLENDFNNLESNLLLDIENIESKWFFLKSISDELSFK